MSQRAQTLRCSQFANVQALDEDIVKDERTERKRTISDLRRDEPAVSPGDAVEDIDLLMADIEALLPCPHANPKFLSETQMLWKQISTVALERPIAIANE